MLHLDNTIRHEISLSFDQKESLLNALPKEIRLQIFSFINPPGFAKLSIICKEWKALTLDPAIWKVFCLQLGLTHISQDPFSDYRFGLAFNQLNLKQNLGNENFVKIQQMPIFREIRCSKENMEDNTLFEIAKQFPKDKKDHFGKKIEGKELFLIFIKAKRGESEVYRFNLEFNPQALDSNEYLYWRYMSGMSSGFYLSKHDKADYREMELSCAWDDLQGHLGANLSNHNTG